MVIIYYSYAKNTDRFVQRHLLPALNEKLPSLQNSMGINVAFRVHADGPRGEVTFIDFPYSNVANKLKLTELDLPPKTDVLFVTPTYGQFNHEIHRAENFTPEPMVQAMEWVINSRHPSDTDSKMFVAVGGNRTFGKDFVVQDRIPSQIERVGDFELSGSDTEAAEIVNNIRKAGQR